MNILRHLTSPLAVEEAMAECDVLGRDQFLTRYGFGFASEYVLNFDGRDYDSKAIAAVAFGYQHGGPPLTNEECQGGKSPGKAAWSLDRLGFRISGLNKRSWRIDEIKPAIDAYFRILERSTLKQPTNEKAELIGLHQKNPKRSLGAFRLKFQNISSALKLLGRSYLPDFKPMKGDHIQRVLVFLLEDKFGRTSPPVEIPARSDLKLRAKIDWALRDEQNRKLGEAGEQYVLSLEKDRLLKSGKPDLSARVSRVSEKSDSYGFDIISFDDDGNEIHIEVKTTEHNLHANFYVSQNEILQSQQKSDSYQLHRVYNFSTERAVKIFRGPLHTLCELSPISFRAKLL